MKLILVSFLHPAARRARWCFPATPLLGLCALLLGASPGLAQTFNVTTTADSGADSLRQAITDANNYAGAATIEIQAGLGTITLASELPILKNPAGITINGNGNTVDGGSTSATTGFRVFFLGVPANTPAAGSGSMPSTANTTWNINDLTIRNGNARGGAGGAGGGGGGAGLGGGIVVNAGSLNLSNVAFVDNRAVGGNGGVQATGSGRGGGGGMGGMGGNGGTVSPSRYGGGGGFGAAAHGGADGSGQNGLFLGAAQGGNGSTSGNLGGAHGGGGGGGIVAGGGGGIAGITPTGRNGGAGGFGGGGGAGNNAGGQGGYGGGGGGAYGPYNGGAGGFGGGGGGAGRGTTPLPSAGSGGFGGGSGGTTTSDNGGRGGGGLGAGGALFVRQGATVTILDGSLSGGSVTAGAAGGTGASAGQAIGSAMFLAGSATYSVSDGNTVTIADTLGGGTHVLITGGFTKTGPGRLVLTGTSSHTGGTTVTEGALLINNTHPAGTPVTVGVNGVLGGSGSVGPVTVNGTLAPGTSVGTLNTGAETWNAGGSYEFEINNATGTAGAASGWDLVNITGTLTLSATSENKFTLKLRTLAGGSPGQMANFNPALPYTWRLATASSGITGFAADKFATDTTGFLNAWGGGTFSVAQQGNNLVLQYLPPAPEIAVEQPAGTDLTSGGSTVAFGLVNLGASGPTKTFTIRNTGGADLTGLAVTKSGANAADFTVNTAGMATTLAPGGSTTFTVTFTPGAVGARAATLHIASNDANENPFILALTGTGQNSAPQGADKTITLTAGQTYPILPVDWGFSDPLDNPPNTFVAVKLATLPAAGQVQVDGQAAAEGQFVLMQPMPAVVTYTAPAGPGTYTLGFQVQDDGVGENLDPTPNTLTFHVPPPEIAVEQPAGTDLTSGVSTVDFGLVNLGASGPTKTFTIRNTGGSDLTGLAVTKSGADGDDFAVDTTGMATTLAPGGSTTFTVTFTPGAAGARAATLHLASNDPDENPFNLAVTGAGVVPFATTLYWRAEAGNGHWDAASHWWRTTPEPQGTQAPIGLETLRFNNPHEPDMNNDLAGGAATRYRMFFDPGSAARTISGGIVNTFVNDGANLPKIENNSGQPQTLGFPIAVNSPGGLELNPVDGGITLTGALDNDGNPLLVYGDNGKILTLAGPVSGAGKLVLKQNSQVKYAAPGGGWTGDTEIDAGQFWLGADGSFAPDGRIYVGNSSLPATAAKLGIEGAGGALANPITVRAGNAGTRVLGGRNASGTATISGNITLQAQTVLEAPEPGGALVFSGVISGTPAWEPIIKTGPGTVVLSNANVFSWLYGGAGTSLPIQAGTLRLAHANAAGDVFSVRIGGSGSGDATLELDGGLVLNNRVEVSSDGSGGRRIANTPGTTGLAVFNGSLDISSATTLYANAGGGVSVNPFSWDAPLTVDGPGESVINFSGGGGGGGFSSSLTKNGPGTLSLAGSSGPFMWMPLTINAGQAVLTSGSSLSLSQPTVINGGTLLVNGTLSGSGAFTVNSAGRVGGTGTINKPLTVHGTVAPGASIGTLTTGSETWNGGGAYEFELNDALGTAGVDPGWDLLNITGTLTITATNKPPADVFTIKIVGPIGGPANFNPAAYYSWPIATTTVGVSGFKPGNFLVDDSAFGVSHSGIFGVVLVDQAVHLVYAPLAAPCANVTVPSALQVGNTMQMTFVNPSGLASAQGLVMANCTVSGEAFAADNSSLGAVGPLSLTLRTDLPLGTVKVVLVATKVVSGDPATVNVITLDTCGRGVSFDPIITTLEVLAGEKVVQRFEGLPAAEHYLFVQNGAPGLTRLDVNLNGRVFTMSLADGQERAADLRDAMLEGDNNVVILTGYGAVGSSAFVTLTDTRTGREEPVEEIILLTLAAAADGLKLRWPETLEGWTLQSAATPDGGWTGVSTPPTAEGGQWTLTVTPDAGAKFYRLAGPAATVSRAAAAIATGGGTRATPGGETPDTETRNSKTTHEGLLW